MTDQPSPNADDFDRKSGSAFFGIDGKYLVNVSMKEIYHLVRAGFSYESLMKMSLEQRRYYFSQWVEENTPKEDK